MRCSNCDYRLWNLPSRVCPECGTSFKPGDFEFPINSVQFCCPHCDQSYYGTGDKGHLVPIEFDCVACKKHIHMDDMVLLPTAGVEEEQTRVDVVPWLERERRGRFRAWFATVGMAIARPRHLIRIVPTDSPLHHAFRFSAATVTPALLFGALPFFVAILFSLTAAGVSGGNGLIPVLVALGIYVGAIFLAGAGILLFLGLFAHAVLKLTGGTAHPRQRTCQAVYYAAGSSVFMAIPCIGPLLGWIGWVVSAAIMLKEGQKVHGVRAVLAVATLPVLMTGAMIGLQILAMTMAMTASPFQTAPTLAQAILTYAEEHEGNTPSHAIVLVYDGTFTPDDLVGLFSITALKDVPVGDTTLDKFEDLTLEGQRKVVDAAAEALPDGVIAHRLGDSVFTYHGIDLANPDPDLWLVVLSPDPDVNAAGTMTGQIPVSQGTGPARVTATSTGGMLIVGRADGMPEYIPLNSISTVLSVQNTLRAKYNLPPLPDPATVTHAKPAVAPAQPATDSATNESEQRQDDPLPPGDNP